MHMHLESFRAVRWMRTINLVLQAILVTTLFIGLNIVAIQYALRFDITESHRHSLSPETISYLGDLKRPVRVVVTFTEDNADSILVSDVRGMLREYSYASASSGNPLTFDFLDPFQRQADAAALGINESNTIIFMCGDKRRSIRPEELYKREGGERRELLAEQVFTAALLDVSSTERKKIYFLTGHGELQPNDTQPGGLAVLRDQLRVRNFATEMLNLNQAKRVPDDASLVVIAGPNRIDPFAEEQLRQYMRDRAGRVLLLLAPRVRHGLSDLLLDWGVILANNDIIVDANPENITPDGNLQIPATNFARHPITQSILDNNLSLIVGWARSVSKTPGTNARSGTVASILATASPTAWGETTTSSISNSVMQPGDIRGTPALGIAVASERVQARGNLTFSVKGGRLVVIGCADFASNARLPGNPGNLAFLLNSINWAVDRDAQLAIPPRHIEKYQVSLSQQQLSRLRLALVLGVPGLAALLGFAVYWTRRS